MKHTPNDPFNPSRRRLLSGIAASAAGAATLAACGSSGEPGSPPGSGAGTGTGVVTIPTSAGLPAPEKSDIDHIVVVMMENRSFDHYLGWLPGADGVQGGRSFVDNKGATQKSFRLTDFQNCAAADPDHSYEGGRIELNNGAMDGFLKTSSTVPPDTFPIGYYTEADLPFFGPAARAWTVCDRYFSGILAETYPNRFYVHSGQTDRLHNSEGPSPSVLPTVWDALAKKNLTGYYFYNDIPFTALWGSKYLNISLPFTTFQAMAAAGSLPSVSYIDPTFLGEGNGVSHDDHPLADVRNGQYFLSQVYDAVRNSPNWSKTLLIVTYDEWGGFADHVVPPFGVISDAERALTAKDGSHTDGRLGFRIPNLLIGPRARRGHIDSQQFDHTSILNLICWRFGLDASFYPRSKTSNNFALALEFSKAADTSAAPAFTVPSGPFGLECNLASYLPSGTGIDQLDASARSRAEHILDLQALSTKAKRYGFTILA